LDVTNNEVLLSYGSSDPISTIAGWIETGYAAATWTGSGIISSLAETNRNYGLGYADGADGVVAGLPSGQIEILYTLLGDANLDGTVNAEDYTPFSNHLGQSGMMWDDGDFNYDGTVNAEDYTVFAQNIGQSDNIAAGVLLPANGILSSSTSTDASGAGSLSLATHKAKVEQKPERRDGHHT
jgi:Dockerin type I domain